MSSPLQRLQSGLSYKRLEAGKFVSNWQSRATEELDYTGLKLLLEGVQVRGYRKRYARPNTESQTSTNSGIL